jgi:thiamine biosynthesis lipoprotein
VSAPRPALAACAALLALALAACGRGPAPVHEARILAFGTLVDVSVHGVDRALAERAFAVLEADFDWMHEAWHAWRPGTLERFNRGCASGEPFALEPDLRPLIALATGLSERSGRLFNPAIGRLVDLWGFHADQPRPGVPPAEAIAPLVAAEPHMGEIRMQDLEARCLDPMVQLDFGGFAKGFGVDRAVEALQDLGIDDAIVNAGGDLRAIGRRGDRPWRVGVRHPRDPEGVYAALELAGDESVFTSGDYERFYEVDGQRYHHILDPRTGYPARGTAAVTVVHDDATEADAAATALFVAGPQGWREVAARMGIRQVMLITTGNEVLMTPEMAERVRLLVEPESVRVAPLPAPDQRESAATS